MTEGGRMTLFPPVAQFLKPYINNSFFYLCLFGGQNNMVALFMMLEYILGINANAFLATRMNLPNLLDTNTDHVAFTTGC